MMPPPLHVCNGLANPANEACRMYCEFMKTLATWQHWFDVDSNFLSYLSLVQFRSNCNQFMC